MAKRGRQPYDGGKNVFCPHCDIRGKYYPKTSCTQNGMGQYVCPEGHRCRVNPIVRKNRPRVDATTVTRHTARFTCGETRPRSCPFASRLSPSRYSCVNLSFCTSKTAERLRGMA